MRRSASSRWRTILSCALTRCAQQSGFAECKAMIDRTLALPVSQQARLVGIAKSSVYYRAQPVSGADQLLMRRIDELHME